ncbi:MAG: signal peptide peptidase SppA [Alphaproteobacteria bacterium]|nr:signal peptide peptidase SppA [Alphaproteobacteria bacterium]
MKRILVGILASIGFLTLLTILGAGALVWMFLPEDEGLPDRVVLTLDLRHGFDEAARGASLAALDFEPGLTLADAIMAIDRAGEEGRVAGLIARIDGSGPGFAQSQELREAIRRFRGQGKFAYAFSTSFGEFGPGTLGYYLASAFDEIHLQPLGAVGLTGLYLETPLLKDFFAKLGVTPSGDKRGPYKTAGNMFTENSLTREHRESLEWLAASLADQITEGIALDRGFDAAAVAALIDDGPFSADEAFHNGLVDRLSYWDEVVARAEKEAGSNADLIDLEMFAGLLPDVDGADEVIALIEGVGQIQEGDNGDGPGGWVMGADTIARAIGDAIDDSEVRAILFRISSGGGSAVASETIGRQIRRAVALKKPVIVSMGDVAASGGYWIAMDATRIVADPGTLTGSIGVLAGKPVLDGLWEKLGVNWGTVGRGANAAMWSMNQDYGQRGRERLNRFLDQIYAAFTEGVARGRGMSVEDVHAIAEGRVWTGLQAKELGLVDELGGFTRALELARVEIGLDPDQPVDIRRFPIPKAPWELALELIGEPLSAIQTFSSWVKLLRNDGLAITPPVMIR